MAKAKIFKEKDVAANYGKTRVTFFCFMFLQVKRWAHP